MSSPAGRALIILCNSEILADACCLAVSTCCSGTWGSMLVSGHAASPPVWDLGLLLAGPVVLVGWLQGRVCRFHLERELKGELLG